MSHWWKVVCSGVDVDSGLTLADVLQLWLDWCLLAVRRAALCCVFLCSRSWQVCQELLKVESDGRAGGTYCAVTDPSIYLPAHAVGRSKKYQTKRAPLTEE